MAKKRKRGKHGKGHLKTVRIPGRGTRCMWIPVLGRPRFVSKNRCR